MNKLELAAKARDFLYKYPYGMMKFQENEIIVLPTVFPPIFNTSMFAQSVEELTSQFLEKHSECRLFEMGVGTGAVILTVAKQKGVIASASDISPMAVLNAKANALWWGIECKIYQGNLFENVPEGKFDIIIWNVPFIREDPGEIEDIRFRMAFDPDYKYLTQFLADVKHRLVNNGQIVLAVDRTLCDLDTIYRLIDEAGFRAQVYKEDKFMWDVELLFACLLLTRKELNKN